MQTTAYYRPSGGFETSGQADVSFDYFQVGGNLEAPHGRVVPYLGLSIGATRLAPIDGSGNDFSFSAVLDGGVKIMLTQFLDLRVIGRMPLSFVTGEAAALCVGGVGCAVHYSGQPLLPRAGPCSASVFISDSEARVVARSARHKANLERNALDISDFEKVRRGQGRIANRGQERQTGVGEREERSDVAAEQH